MADRKRIYLCLAHMSEEGIEQKYIKEAFDTNWVVPLGPNVNGFEEDLTRFLACKERNVNDNLNDDADDNLNPNADVDDNFNLNLNANRHLEGRLCSEESKNVDELCDYKRTVVPEHSRTPTKIIIVKYNNEGCLY